MPLARPATAFVVLALTLAVVAGTVLNGSAARAEDPDVGALFDVAKKAWAEKRYGKCVADLRTIVAEVARRRLDQIRATLPPAPAGWTADEATDDGDAAALLSVGLGVQRRYEKGEASVRIQLIADSPFVAPVATLLQNPTFLPPSTKVVTVKGRKALLETEDEGKRTSVRLLLHGDTTMLSIEGEGATKADVAETFANTLDLDALEKVLAE